MWEEELEQVEKIEDMETLQNGAGKRKKDRKTIWMLGLAALSLSMFAVAVVTSYRTSAKLLTVRRELEDAVSVNLETYLTQHVPEYVVGTVAQQRDEVAFTQEQTAELAETVRETLAEDITKEVLSGRDELDAEKIRRMEEKLTVSVKEKLEQMELLTLEGIPVKGEDYFTKEELAMIVADTTRQVKVELAKALEDVSENTEGLSRMLVRQNNLQSDIEELRKSSQEQYGGIAGKWSEADMRLRGLEQYDADGRLTVLEQYDADGRLSALEQYDTDGRLAVLEQYDVDARLKALEGSDMGQRLELLEKLGIAERLSQLESIGAGLRLGDLEGIEAAGRLAALEAFLGIGGSGAGSGSLQQKVEQLQEAYEELKASFQTGCEQIAAACTARNITPKSHSPRDIAEAIRSLPEARPEMDKVKRGNFGEVASIGAGPWKAYPGVGGQQYMCISCNVYNNSDTEVCRCELSVTGTKDGATVTLYRKSGERPARGSCILGDGSELIDIYGYTDLEIRVESGRDGFCSGTYTIFY